MNIDLEKREDYYGIWSIIMFHVMDDKERYRLAHNLQLLMNLILEKPELDHFELEIKTVK